jgi:hypothetical protein
LKVGVVWGFIPVAMVAAMASAVAAAGPDRMKAQVDVDAPANLHTLRDPVNS